MKETRILMGMPVSLEIVDWQATQKDLDEVYAYFKQVDERFSTYKEESEISKINRHELSENQYSKEMQEVFALSDQTKTETHGYFDIKAPLGHYDPSGLVKGWAINKAAKILDRKGFKNFYVDAGGDIQTRGYNASGQKWKVGIRNPFESAQIVKTVELSGQGIATSGTYIRGAHIYDPHNRTPLTEIVSLTVIGPNIYDADRFATAAFAMGSQGILFIEKLPGFEAFAIDQQGVATLTSGFDNFVIQNDPVLQR